MKTFANRHIGPSDKETKEMVKAIGVESVDALIDQTVPAQIRLKNGLDISEEMSEYEYLQHVKELGSQNQVYKSYIGQGYYNTIVPPVILRNILENPGWYTAYTPYQAEISQGRLEALLNFQTMVMDLTGMEIANASLLDEATAAAEGMIMLYNSRKRDAVKRGVIKFFVADHVFPQTLSVLKNRSEALGIELIIGDWKTAEIDDSFFGALIQYPTANGTVENFKGFATKIKEKGVSLVVAADIMSLALLTPPGEWGADVVVGTTQRLGVPMGCGGPHAAYFATSESFKRNIPGRIIGVSVDSQGNQAYRMALQTREQHIRREKATSNICTAQALLAIMAGMYGVYHGPDGIKEIASDIHSKTVVLADQLKAMGITLASDAFFDTIQVEGLSADEVAKLTEESDKAGINFFVEGTNVSISLDETTTIEDVTNILNVFATALGKDKVAQPSLEAKHAIPSVLVRTSTYLQHPVFSAYQSETELMRYLKRLENKDISLVHSMISLGSCTMKLNAAAELMPITWPEFADIHPFAPKNQLEGYYKMIDQLEADMSEITGFAAVSFQPNSGAQGEYAGLMVIREYHKSNGDHNRNIALIPSSAHGTNPASAVMAGMKVVVVKCDEEGNIDVADLKDKAEKHKDELSCLMVTYPSTHGVYEEAIQEITAIIHEFGGQVYMDGANMNAQVGLTNPGNIGADVCHLNLHKTFAIPHGGGGPGMGPIGVAAHLKPFLPKHPLVGTGGDQGIEPVAAAQWGSALILLISYGYVKMLGKSGVTDSTKLAILNANYMKARLEGHYDVLYVGSNGRVAHEMIVDCRPFKKSAGVEVEDIAKRLIDYGFHAPTVSFPVAGTMMIEPTESESKAELDRFCDALLQIRQEIEEVAEGKASGENNVLKNAPHTAAMVTADEWNYEYSRSKAAYPVEYLRENKFWVSVGRVDNAYGDRNLVCSCPGIDEYAEATV